MEGAGREVGVVQAGRGGKKSVGEKGRFERRGETHPEVAAGGACVRDGGFVGELEGVR